MSSNTGMKRLLVRGEATKNDVYGMFTRHPNLVSWFKQKMEDENLCRYFDWFSPEDMEVLCPECESMTFTDFLRELQTEDTCYRRLLLEDAYLSPGDYFSRIIFDYLVTLDPPVEVEDLPLRYLVRHANILIDLFYKSQLLGGLSTGQAASRVYRICTVLYRGVPRNWDLPYSQFTYVYEIWEKIERTQPRDISAWFLQILFRSGQQIRSLEDTISEDLLVDAVMSEQISWEIVRARVMVAGESIRVPIEENEEEEGGLGEEEGGLGEENREEQLATQQASQARLKRIADELEEEDERRKRNRRASDPKTAACKKMNNECLYKPLDLDDWCEHDPKFYYGPDERQRCWDAKELVKHIEAQLTSTKYGNPYPQYPTDPWTREPIPLKDLTAFSNFCEERGIKIPTAFQKLVAFLSGNPNLDGLPFDQSSMRHVIDLFRNT